MMDFKKSLVIFLKGLGMGSADIIPGVSGGTMALILGIYERLVFAIKRINFNLKSIEWEFFIPLLSGIGVAFLTLARVIKFLLTNFQALTYAFFFGLILASAVIVYKRINERRGKDIFFLFLGFSLAFLFLGLEALESEHSLPIIFFSGMIAICAMILPGISGAFILLFLNQYEYMLGALNSFALAEIVIFISGALLGILAFSRILGFLLEKYHSYTLSFLVGLMLGSLRLPYQKMLGEISLLLLIPVFLGIAMVFILEVKAGKF